MSQPGTPQAAALASLFIEAVRQGQALWFRVASNSMLPLMRLGDNVYIQPAAASEIRPGEIAAFETADGLVIHRIIHHQQTEDTVRLLQMSDVEFLPGWVKAQAVVGRVVSIRRRGRQVDLHRPIAKWCGRVTARIRYRLYLHHKNRLLQVLLRACSRLVTYLGYRCIHYCCASAVTNNNSCL